MAGKGIRNGPWVIPQQQTVTTRAGIITFFVLALIQSHFLALRYPPLATENGVDILYNPRHHIIHINVFFLPDK